jgi:hypothetical protein
MKVQLVNSNNTYFHSDNNVKRSVSNRKVSKSDSLSSLKSKPSFISRIFSCLADLFRAFISIFSGKKEVYKVPQLGNVRVQFLPDEIAEMRTQFWKLGAEKSKEVLPLRFDKGSKQAMINIEQNAFPFIDAYLGARMDSRLFLELHKAVCFDLKAKRGMFRDGSEIGVAYFMGEEIQQDDLNEFLSSGSGTYKMKGKECQITFVARRKEEISRLVDLYFSQFYDAMKNHKTMTHQGKTHQIAQLAQALYFLHPPRDGRKRTVLLIMQKLFTEYLGHPGIFKNIHLLPMRALKKLEQDCLEAFTNWDAPIN